jgi:hypothetical protein
MKMTSSPRSGRRRVAQGKASDFLRATPWVSDPAKILLVLAWADFPRQLEEKTSVNTDCRPRASRPGVAFGSCYLVRCALGYFLMALQAVFIEAPMVTLETERLVLRMFRESDLDSYAEMCADEVVMRYISTGKTLSLAEARVKS